MTKRLAVALLAVALALTTTVVGAQGVFTRGDFAAQLVEAAGLEGTGDPVDVLVAEGIMQGYPDGAFGASRPISRLEAVTLAAKVMGLEADVTPPVAAQVELPQDHWGYSFYGWFSFLGLVDGDPYGAISQGEAVAMLERVFSSDAKAVELLEKAQGVVELVEGIGISTVMEGTMKMVLRPGVPGAEELPETDMAMRLQQAFVLPDMLHQVTSFKMPIPGLGPLDITMESYLVDGKMYQQLPNPETGEMTWFQYPEDFLGGLGDILSQQLETQTEIIPAGMEEYFQYKYLGTVDLEGESVHAIGFYGRVDNFQQFVDAAMGQFAGGFQDALGGMLEILDSASYWGVQYVSVEDYQVRQAQYVIRMNYAPEFAGEPIPLEAMQMEINILEYSVHDDLEIIVPEEVLAAPVLDLFMGFQPEGVFVEPMPEPPAQ